ncbi:calpastatin isoform X9 [Anarrhichthys ocellatus]|uniref:calpastatin isoform X9 n=1 Tax=Anarrhichthys ocellatus TaxID=433405 RepID=UPI0012EDA4B3|nr:calpastatin isoform X9 [Anarrhichthys ocellatus]
MGQILTWFRGPRDGQALQDVSVEEQSQPSQATPKPAAQASTVKPALFEKASSGSAMATKPEVFTAAAGGATQSGVTAGGSASIGNAEKAKPETNTAPTAATVIDMSSAGATFVDMTSAGPRGFPKEMSKTAAVSQIKASATVPSAAAGVAAAAGIAAATAVTKPKESPKGTAKSATATTTVRADVHKVDPAKSSKPVATAAAGNVSVQGKTEAKPTQTKVQVEVPPAAAKGVKEGPVPADVKPEDVPKPMSTGEALDSLSDAFMTPAAPKKQEVRLFKHDKKPKMEKVSADFSLMSALDTKVDTKPKTDGGDSMSLDALSALVDTLPEDKPKPELPELRPEDIVSEEKHKKEKGVLVGEREDSIAPEYRFYKDVLKEMPAPKPEPSMGTGEALGILSGDFMTAAAAPAVHAPLPAKKAPAVPSADKKVKMGNVSDDFSLEAGLDLPTVTKVEPVMAVCHAAPPGKKMAAGKDDGKQKYGQDDSMSLDALSALVDTLPEDKPKPELPELRPEDIVSEEKHKKEKGVLVGEREDSIAPDYRFKEDNLKKLPAPKPEPTMGAGEAMDFLSEGFTTSSSAPAVQAPVITPSAPPAQTKVEDLSAIDLLLGDFVAPTKASGVQAPAPPPTKKTPEKTVCPLEQAKPKTDTDDSMSLDALSALVDTLPEDKPKPELPELRPEDIVSEDKHKKEKGVLLGERDDTLPPEYRFNEAELKKLPAPKPEPTMGTGEAMDFLSEGFMTSSSAPAVQAPVITPSAPPAQPSSDFVLNAMAAEFVSSSAAPKVKSAVCAPTETAPELSGGAGSALDALSDTLKDIAPAPQPAPPPAKDIVKEKKVVEERLIKLGEKDDSLPPEYRLIEEELKKMADAKARAAAPAPKEKTMDDKTALDLLSSDFSVAPKPAAPAASCAVTTKLEPPVLDSEPLKPMAGPVLLPDTPEFKSKTDKPKSKSKSKSKSKKHQAEEPSATEQLPAQQSSDVVPKSAKKGGRS